MNNLFDSCQINKIVQNSIRRLFKIENGAEDKFEILNCHIRNAGDTMLGFLGEYWRVSIDVLIEESVISLKFFVKSIPRSNGGKAKMIKDMKSFEKEALFYTTIKKSIDPEEEQKENKRWSASIIGAFEMDLVFEDLTAKGFKPRNKFERFDVPHCKEALKSLARFHSRSIVYEERKSVELNRKYTLLEDFQPYIDKGNFNSSNLWFHQCMVGAFEALKQFSQYRQKLTDVQVRLKWQKIWTKALDICEPSDSVRNVICHHDLWNNNILFHYDSEANVDGCIFVDFQAIQYQPLVGDVMMLLYCNLNSKVREQHMKELLDFYYESLEAELQESHKNINEIIDKLVYHEACEENRLWGSVIAACLLPQFWIDDNVTTKTFEKSENFENHLLKDKASFIMNLMKSNNSYKLEVIQLFEEILERYILQ